MNIINKRDRKKISQPEKVYHMTARGNLESILKDGKILADWAGECFFFKDLKDIPIYINLTGALKGRQYYDQIKGVLTVRTDPPLIISDTVILCLTPRYKDNNWYKEITNPERYNKSQEDIVNEFDNCRVMYHGDMKFKSSPEIIELSSIMTADTL